MGKLILLLAVFLSIELAYSQGDAPALLKGQGQTSNQVGSFIQVPNNLVTRINSATGLLETGNNNILVNPSFEHSSYLTGWTSSGTGSNAQELVNEIHGLKAVAVTTSAQTIDLSQSSTLYAAQFADGVQGLASIRVKTNHTGTCSVCSVQAGTVSTTNCVSVQANNKWGLYKVPMILGATSNGISLACTSGTGTTYVDDAFVGAVDLKADVDQSRIAGESYFAGTTSCEWPRSSSTVASFNTVSACPGPTIVGTPTLGSWQTTDSDLPRQTINNLPAGRYKATFLIENYTSGGNAAIFAITDGSTTCEPQAGNNSNAYATSVTLSCTFTYTSSGNRSFEVVGGVASGSIYLVNNRTAPRLSTKFILEYFGSGSVYTSTNADTDWASCNFSSLAWQGLGTVTSDLKCKRDGSDLLMRGRITLGTVGASEARIPLPVWNGLTLTTASNISVTESNGSVRRNNSSGSNTKNYNALILPSVQYINLSTPEFSTTISPLTAQTGSALFTNSDVISLENLRIPISGWTNSNIIIGQFNGLESCADTLECTDTFSAKVSSAGVVSDENVDWINGSCSYTTGNWSCSFNSSIFTVSPNCTASSQVNRFVRVNAATSSAVSGITYNDSGVADNQAFQIICQKQGADYIGKTAKAVASDQNVRTPGVTNAVVSSVTTSGTCSSSPCTIQTNLGNLASSVTRSTTGDYRVNINTAYQGMVWTCSCSSVSLAVGVNNCQVYRFDSTSLAVSTSNLSGTFRDARFDLVCHGQLP